MKECIRHSQMKPVKAQLIAAVTLSGLDQGATP